MTKPTLVFLHGLLGDGRDWQALQPYLADFHCIFIDLPSHGRNAQVTVADFAEADAFLAQTLAEKLGQQPYVLIGYSLGGRLALHFALQSALPKGQLLGLIVEGANFGLSSETEKAQRWINDLAWAERFENQALPLVLNDWYQQPVFAHLSAKERAALIEKRGQQQGAAIAAMLKATSLAKQPDFRLCFSHLPAHFYYFCGEKDHKFQTMAKEAGIAPMLIENAGHNAHLENTEFFAKKLRECLLKIAQA